MKCLCTIFIGRLLINSHDGSTASTQQRSWKRRRRRCPKFVRTAAAEMEKTTFKLYLLMQFGFLIFTVGPGVSQNGLVKDKDCLSAASPYNRVSHQKTTTTHHAPNHRTCLACKNWVRIQHPNWSKQYEYPTFRHREQSVVLVASNERCSSTI